MPFPITSLGIKLSQIRQKMQEKAFAKRLGYEHMG